VYTVKHLDTKIHVHTCVKKDILIYYYKYKKYMKLHQQ